MEKSRTKRTLNARYRDQGGIKAVCLHWYYGSKVHPACTYREIAERITLETGVSVSVGTLGRWMHRWIIEDGKDRTHEHASA